MKTLVGLLIGIWLFPLNIFAMEPQEFDRVLKELKSKNFAVVEKFLESNKQPLADDPEYYVILLNYVFLKGDKSSVEISAKKPKEKVLDLHDPETGDVKGYVGSRVEFDEGLIVSGITQTQASLPKFNSRLDIHFGIVSIAEQIGRWDIVGAQLVKVLESSVEIDNKWVWGPVNSMEGDPKEFMIQNVLNKTNTLFRIGNPSTDKVLASVSQALIKYYPNLIYGYANLGVLHLANREYEQAEKYFDQAIAIDPNDQIVLSNLKRLKALRKE